MIGRIFSAEACAYGCGDPECVQGKKCQGRCVPPLYSTICVICERFTDECIRDRESHYWNPTS